MSVTSSTPDTPSRRRGVAGATVRGSRRRLSPWLLLPILVALAAVAFILWRVRGSSATAAVTTGQVARTDLTVSVTGSGSIQPARSLDLAFQVSGQVADVLVEP